MRWVFCYVLSALSVACGEQRSDVVEVDGVSSQTTAAQTSYCSPVAVRCVPEEYATIQAAVDAAQAGDTVSIWAHNGSFQYMEHVVISTAALTVRGRDASTTVQIWTDDPDRAPITVNANGVTIEYLEIHGTTHWCQLCDYSGILVASGTSGVTIRYNEITSSGVGVLAYQDVSHLKVDSNHFMDNYSGFSGEPGYGGALTSSDICNNTFSGYHLFYNVNVGDVYIPGEVPFTSNNRIFRNTAINAANPYYTGQGINFTGVNNEVTDNTIDGVRYDGIYATVCTDGCTVTGNTLKNAHRYGMFFNFGVEKLSTMANRVEDAPTGIRVDGNNSNILCSDFINVDTYWVDNGSGNTLTMNCGE